MRNEPIIHDSDGHLLQGIAQEQCDLGLVNTYYPGRELAKDPTFPVGLFWANQQDRGTHVNISGGGVAKNSRNKENAIKLLEFLSSPEAQNLFADDNMEYSGERSRPAVGQARGMVGGRFQARPGECGHRGRASGGRRQDDGPGRVPVTRWRHASGTWRRGSSRRSS